MTNPSRPSTSCQIQRPSLTDDNDHLNNNNGKQFLSRSLTFDTEQKQQKQQQQQRVTRPSRPSPTISEQLPQRLGRSLLSNDNWRQETMVDIRINAKAIEQSDQNILFGRGIDPLPHVREMLTELSNTEALLYARQCRVVVAKLRLCWGDINEEIKSLLKHKEYTEAAIDHIRKDLIINNESVKIRKKPKREAKLDEVRKRVTKVGKERSVVTELICQCLTHASRTFELTRFQKLDNAQTRRASIANPPARPTSALGFRPPRSTRTNPLSTTMTSSNSNLNNTNVTAESTLLDENGLPLVGHLLPFTPDVIQVFQEAAKLIEESGEIKKQAMNQIKDAFNDAKAYSLTVNQSVAQKLADIITLAQHLTISLGENSIAQHRAQRWFDLTMSAQRCNAGPLSSSSFKIFERLDRPIIRTFQKHPGNQVPEAQITAKVTTDLQQSAEETRKQLKALKIVGQRLQANLIDKEVALEVDAHLLRRRRERSNHKWGVTKYVHV
ncbi:unnamed protein product [Rotaria socialis]|uniref:Uncharacterized protein n=1 Tax=Rotaria socialis TaxID=392032 RepID=A0A820FDG4_9BILA|nr:unnamed protein product [Rotaria socialis]CAF4261976.1 unnamed protein product [Rotaria socialis]